MQLTITPASSTAEAAVDAELAADRYLYASSFHFERNGIKVRVAPWHVLVANGPTGEGAVIDPRFAHLYR
jgi:hypothetical protein